MSPEVGKKRARPNERGTIESIDTVFSMKKRLFLFSKTGVILK
jgi:hypothetical protein